MTEKGTESYVPVVFPAGETPRWEKRYSGRLRWELDELQSAGITPEFDIDAWNDRRLVLSLDWQLDADTTLHLKAVFPDSFPHIRPQVFLISGLDPLPVRHRNPMEGNLCLLGRDSGQWLPSWTLYNLLTEQLKDAVRDTGVEDPQGEPSEFWWNGLDKSGSFCLIDSAWDLDGVKEGTLTLRYVNEGGKKDEAHSAGVIKTPVIRAYVSEVRGKDGSVIHSWNGALPSDLAATNQAMRIPWVRVDDTILPNPNLVEQVRGLRESHAIFSEKAKSRKFGRLMIDLFAVIHPSELGFGETGHGWAIFLLYGSRKAFPSKFTTLPVYRAGIGDIGFRVPAVRALRSKRVLVVGTGAVGAPIAIELARNGCGTLHLIEYDSVEPGNTIRWPLGTSAWGQTKLKALEDFIKEEYPSTTVQPHPHCFGQVGLGNVGSGDDSVLEGILDRVDLVIDGSASHGVTTLLADRCHEASIPLISLFATPTLEGGAVVLYFGEGGCPNCLEHSWHNNEIESPPGLGGDDELTQPPGCAERTFVGAGYDLQELSLQAVRLTVETLTNETINSSLIQTLSFIGEDGHRCPPRWRVDFLPKHQSCSCQI